MLFCYLRNFDFPNLKNYLAQKRQEVFCNRKCSLKFRKIQKSNLGVNTTYCPTYRRI